MATRPPNPATPSFFRASLKPTAMPSPAPEHVPKHVVSVGLGSSTRDAHIETELLGQRVVIERRGTDGNLAKAAAMLKDLDGKVDAFGLGGVVLFVQAAGRRYYMREAVNLAKNAPQTPTVCGAGLKNSLERLVVERLDDTLHWHTKRVLMVSGVENFGMAEALDALGAKITYADLIFFLGVPVPLKSLQALARAARILGPVVSQLPISWLYPTGSKQETNRSGWRGRYFEDADVIAGDFHLIRRYLPDTLTGKIILTQTTTQKDVELLRQRGVKTLITTTPRFEGRSLSTNMLEAALVALSGKHPLSDTDYRELIEQSGLAPDVLELNP